MYHITALCSSIIFFIQYICNIFRSATEMIKPFLINKLSINWDDDNIKFCFVALVYCRLRCQLCYLSYTLAAGLSAVNSVKSSE